MTTLRGIVLVLASACMMGAASLMLRSGIERAGGFGADVARLHLDILRLIQQPIFDLGVILYAAGTLVWMRVIATEPISIGYPILVSAAFVVITVGALVLFKEPLSLVKVVGMALILAGVIVVSNG